MVSGHLVLFPALLVKPNPRAATLDEIVFDSHRDGGSDASERIAHEGDKGSVSQPHERARVDGLEELPHLVFVEYGGFADFNDVLRSSDRCGGVGGHDLADD